MRRCRPVTVALLALMTTLVLAAAPLAHAQTTSVLPGTASTANPAASTAVPASPTTGAAPTTTPPPSTATIQTTAVPQTAATTATPAADGPGTDSNDSKLPVLLLAIIGAVLLAAALAIAAARWWAYDPPWLVRSRHATAEAGWRTSAAWAEFRDWLRLGR
jgi:hypothetical protein